MAMSSTGMVLLGFNWGSAKIDVRVSFANIDLLLTCSGQAKSCLWSHDESMYGDPRLIGLSVEACTTRVGTISLKHQRYIGHPVWSHAASSCYLVCGGSTFFTAIWNASILYQTLFRRTGLGYRIEVCSASFRKAGLSEASLLLIYAWSVLSLYSSRHSSETDRELSIKMSRYYFVNISWRWTCLPSVVLYTR